MPNQETSRENAAPPAFTPCALVVDDNALVLMAARDIIEEAGFESLEANSGDEAKAVLDDHGDRIALLFTDIEMPGDTDGLALARYAARRWPDIEIVLASGRAAPGPDDLPDDATFIAKPFGAQLVHDHLREKMPREEQPEPLRSGA